MTSVTLNNTPVVVTSTNPGSTGMAGSYNSYTPVTGDTLVALVTAASASGTTTNPTAQKSGTTGWTKQLEVFNDTSADSNVLVALWTKWAAGGDAAPTFTASKTGSGGTAGAIVVAVLGGTSPTSWDGTGPYGSTSTAATIASETVATTANVTTAGGYALAALARERSAGTTAYSSSAWTTLASTSASAILQFAADGLSNPATGSPVSDTGTWTGTATSAFGAALAVVFKPYVAAGNAGAFFQFL